MVRVCVCEQASRLWEREGWDKTRRRQQRRQRRCWQLPSGAPCEHAHACRAGCLGALPPQAAAAAVRAGHGRRLPAVDDGRLGLQGADVGTLDGEGMSCLRVCNPRVYESQVRLRVTLTCVTEWWGGEGGGAGGGEGVGGACAPADASSVESSAYTCL